MKRHVGSFVLASMMAVSCSIPGSGDVRSIDAEDIPYELNATTTAAPTTTVVVTTTSPAASTTSTSTTVPVEIVPLFFVAGAQLVPINRLLLSPAVAPQVLAALAEGLPEGDPSAGLRTAIPPEFVATVVVLRGIATVDLPRRSSPHFPAPNSALRSLRSC